MKILADANIAYVEQAFADLGDVRAVAASAITPAALDGVGVLLTRSTVKLGPALLAESQVRFVATATSGIDHVDQPWLASRGIGFASAHGSNANSVAEWFAEVLLTHTRDRPEGPAGLRVGVIGVGAVGSRVVNKALALGCTVRRCDPPLARAGGEGFEPLSALLPECDVLTLHVPLERDGLDPTHHLIDASAISAMPSGSLLINASRGSVVHGDAMAAAVASGHITALLDVFEGEPQIDPAHVSAAAIATPHTAGHSLDAKVDGTRMIYEAACAFLHHPPAWDWRTALPPAPSPLDAAALDGPLHHQLLQAARHFCRHNDDDAFVREVVALPIPDRGRRFRHYRRNYPIRREFHTAPVSNATGPLAVALEGLGFKLS